MVKVTIKNTSLKNDTDQGIKMAKCKVCKIKFEARFFLQKTCVDPKCLAEWQRLDREDKADKKHNARKKEFKLTDITHQHKLTQVIFNKVRVAEEKQWFILKGLEPECISCGKKNMDWCCGHFKTRGAQGNLRYDRKNTFLQCNRYCNMGLSGNISGDKNTRGYIQGLYDRFGDKAKSIIDYCESNTEAKKYTGEELKAKRKLLSKQLKDLL